MSDWAHAPVHRLEAQGAYMVTAGTYQKRLILDSPARLSLVRDALFELAEEYQWRLQAWAIMGNHYHFVACGQPQAGPLGELVHRLHGATACRLNESDCSPERKVWYEYWDTHLTYPASFFARLRYVHENPVHHAVVSVATEYPWCSANWFQQMADGALRRTVASFRIDRLKVMDEF